MARGAEAPLSEPSECPVGSVVELFGGRWKASILWFVHGSPRRFNELRRLLPGITQKMLTQQLRQLERDGLVSRTQFPEIPPRVEYSSTHLLEKLVPIFDALHRWGNKYSGQVQQARRRFDKRAQSS